jgi:hypothetical protein
MFFSCPLIILFWPLKRSSEKYYFIVNENYLIIKNISYFWYRKTVPISDVALCYISWVSEAATQFNEFRIIQNDYQSFSFKTAVSVEELRCLYHEIQMRKDTEMPAIGKY